MCAFRSRSAARSSVEPAFSTAIVTTAGGAEQRNSEWADARLSFDAGPGLRSEADLHELIAFFRARRGAAVGFRLEDPFDHSSNGMTGEPGAADQVLGTGDGVRTEFPLVKTYDGQVRRITRPVAGTVRVSVDGVERLSGWTLAPKGVIEFDAAPAEGEAVARRLPLRRAGALRRGPAQPSAARPSPPARSRRCR